MSQSKNNTVAPATATNDVAWSTAARNLIASHPHIAGVSVAAIAAALGHFYYNHKPVTVAMWAAAGLIAGEALSRILAHAKEIEEAAANAAKASEALASLNAKLPAAEGAAAFALNELLTLKADTAKLREEMAAEFAEAKAFRATVVKAKAEAEEPKAAVKAPKAA